MEKPIALIVDDEPDIRELLSLTLARMDIDARTAADLKEARALLARHSFDLCLTDMKLPDGNGIDLVEHIQHHHSRLPTAVLTAHGNVESAVCALKAGAFDFVSKPVDLRMLRSLVNAALRLNRRHGEPAAPALQLLGESPAMVTTRRRIAKLARSQAPVYISGESGTGKELAARLIHAQGPRADKPFVPVNCGAIPEDLMESEFFGHRKGSFTGATANKEGLFQAAQGGTLFLDEVADLPLHMQVKLLRAIQEKAIRPVGESREIPVDVRILSATHKDLDALVEAGEFRQDLFYRINVIELPMPSLRERREDIPLLAEHILDHLAREQGTPRPRLGESALAALARHAFPGNVRELENILERAMTLCDEDVITESDLQLRPPSGDAPTAQGEDGAALSLEPYLGNVEKKTITQALEKTRYNKTAAARLLGISFGALRYRMKKLGLD
ncbi:MAG TPA: sigma-54-dependent Fis family transcriptional regulator [Gammaproteobacteria bacterium]|nr:sigma-54-dependent Fis family transcriptional regulator [Gammaproteobacteria bacterium]